MRARSAADVVWILGGRVEHKITTSLVAGWVLLAFQKTVFSAASFYPCTQGGERTRKRRGSWGFCHSIRECSMTLIGSGLTDNQTQCYSNQYISGDWTYTNTNWHCIGAFLPHEADVAPRPFFFKNRYVCTLLVTSDFTFNWDKVINDPCCHTMTP